MTRVLGLVAVLLTIACAGVSLGCAGEDGGPGKAGAPGADGADGIDGTDGADGVDGQDGVDGTDGVNGSPGEDGADGVNGSDGADGVNGSDGADGADGVNGNDGLGYFPVQAAGVVGLVEDSAGDPVSGGIVYFVPAADVAALPATTVQVGSTNDEPLEDPIAANGVGYQQAVVGSDGRYSLATLTAGSYFVTFVPAATDTTHLPGGSACRTAQNASALIGTRLDLAVSSNPPADASFVGSGVCVSCHGRSHIAETMHRIGIWSPGEAGSLQSFGPRSADMYQSIETKFEAAGGTTVYFSAYDSTRGFDKYKSTEADPGANVAFSVTVRRAAGTGQLEMLLHNVQNAADPDRVYPVDMVYGGGVNKQRFMTRLANASGSYLVTLPLQFQHEGSEASAYGRTSKVWRDYHGDWWYDETTDTFREPATSKSFEKNCISCHAVGVRVTGSDATVWKASLVEDTFFGSGDFDYDGNGIADEVNVGCETCHGPGSRHWESAGQGKHIVSPSLLTPEREAMICGQCHSRPKGALNTDSPVNVDGLMMRAGTARNDFLADHATSQLDGASSDFYADPELHSKSHHQQYSDFIRSAMYKNDSVLMTCSTCHDPHRRTDNARQLRSDPDDNAAACGGCHSSEVSNLTAHLTAKSVPSAAMMANARCIDCHMPKTAKTGAGRPGLILGGIQYWMNDVTSHLFKVPDRALATSQSMPVPYTNECGGCHSSAP